MDLEKGVVYARGLREPSSESMIHDALYKQNRDVMAVMHGHCDLISENVSKLRIPVTKKEEEYGTIDLVNRVLDISNEKSFIEMKNHGFISLGRTISEAGEQVFRIYEQCLV